MIKLVVAGAAGRMGRAILALALRDPEFKIAGGLEREGNPALGKDIGEMLAGKKIGAPITSKIDELLKNCDVLIDFTHPDSASEHLNAAVTSQTAYVLGTTGLKENFLSSLKSSAQKIAIVQSPNMSIGVNLLFKLSEIAGQTLDESYDIEISETHHRMKKDSPSGTALKLLEILAKVRGKNLKKNVVYGREGQTGERPKGQIGVFALRGGDVVGDHTVFFLAEGERFELTHKATSRDAFAQGALRAAKFVAARKNGLYNMTDVLQMSS